MVLRDIGQPHESKPILADSGGGVKYIIPQYWLEKRGNRRHPSRATLDPTEFPYVLGDIVLVDAAPETGEPAHYIRDAVLDRRFTRYEVLALPLAADGEKIDMLATVQRQRPT